MRALFMHLIILIFGFASFQSAHSEAVYQTGGPGPASNNQAEAAFSEDEARIIADYFSSHAANPAGKAKTKRLPPGIAKNLQRGKRLPPGIAKKLLPYDLRQALPEPRSGYERVIVEGKILLIELGTQIIKDILIDAAINSRFVELRE